MDRHSSYSAPRSSRSGSSYTSRSRSSRTRENRSRDSRRNTYRQGPGKKNTLLFVIVPFIIFNLILVYVTTASPRIQLTISDTTDYRTVDISFKVKSLIPVREMTATLESQPLELTREGSTYKATLSDNGTLAIYAKSWNGMIDRANEAIAVLDDASPSIDEDDFIIDNGKLEVTLTDSQSGINYDSIYATDSEGTQIKPVSMDKQTGRVVFDMESDSLAVYAEDMVGNQVQSSFSIQTEGLTAGTRSSDSEDDETASSNRVSAASAESSGSAKASEDTKTKESTKASEATKAKETAKAATETTKAKESAKASGTTKAKETTKASETTKAKETTKASETTKAKETTKASETTKAKETTKASETTKATDATKTSEASATTQAVNPTEAANPTETLSPSSPGPSSESSQSPQSPQGSDPGSSGGDITIVPLS